MGLALVAYNLFQKDYVKKNSDLHSRNLYSLSKNDFVALTPEQTAPYNLLAAKEEERDEKEQYAGRYIPLETLLRARPCEQYSSRIVAAISRCLDMPSLQKLEMCCTQLLNMGLVKQEVGSKWL